MSKKNKKLDCTKYDIDKEYVEGENYGKTELVKILDPEYQGGELSESLVYDRLKNTVESKLEEDFHIDIDVFKNKKNNKDNKDNKDKKYPPKKPPTIQ